MSSEIAIYVSYLTGKVEILPVQEAIRRASEDAATRQKQNEKMMRSVFEAFLNPKYISIYKQK